MDKMFDELTIEEVEEMYKNGWEFDINDGQISGARRVLDATDRGFKGVIFW